MARLSKAERSELARQLSLSRTPDQRRGGGSKRRIEHIPGLPIGSRETDNSRGYKAYKCMCLDCRIARGHAPAPPGYLPPSAGSTRNRKTPTRKARALAAR